MMDKISVIIVKSDTDQGELWQLRADLIPNIEEQICLGDECYEVVNKKHYPSGTDRFRKHGMVLGPVVILYVSPED